MGALYTHVDSKNALFLAEEKSLARFGGRGVHSSTFFSDFFQTFFSDFISDFFFRLFFQTFFRPGFPAAFGGGGLSPPPLAAGVFRRRVIPPAAPGPGGRPRGSAPVSGPVRAVRAVRVPAPPWGRPRFPAGSEDRRI